MIILFLTCGNEGEADIITRELLKARLVACVRKLPVQSAFRWEGAIDNASEVLLMMESVEAKFRDIEKVVRQHHQYDTFVLTAVPVAHMSKGVQAWLDESLK